MGENTDVFGLQAAYLKEFDNSFNRDYGISFKKSSDYEVFQLDLNFYF